MNLIATEKTFSLEAWFPVHESFAGRAARDLNRRDLRRRTEDAQAAAKAAGRKLVLHQANGVGDDFEPGPGRVARACRGCGGKVSVGAPFADGPAVVLCGECFEVAADVYPRPLD